MLSLKEPSSFSCDELVEDQVDVARLAVRREPHHLVLARVHLEAGVVGERRVEHAERVRVVQLGEQLEVLAAPDAVRRRRPLADAVHREHGGLLERRRVERARGVRLVVLGEEQLALVAAELRADAASPVKSFSFSHTGIAVRNELQPLRRDAEVVLEDALELEERLVVEADVVELGRRRCPPRGGSTRRRAAGNSASCFLRVKRSSCAAATISPSRTRQAAESW